MEASSLVCGQNLAWEPGDRGSNAWSVPSPRSLSVSVCKMGWAEATGRALSSWKVCPVLFQLLAQPSESRCSTVRLHSKCPPPQRVSISIKEGLETRVFSLVSGRKAI